jgi:hypothetical protein
MNNLFTKKATAGIRLSSSLLSERDFDYEKYYISPFEYMVEKGALEYTSPLFLINKMNEFKLKFREDYKEKFESVASEDHKLLVLYQSERKVKKYKTCKTEKQKNRITKEFESLEDFYDQLADKYVGNLLEALMECCFKIAKIYAFKPEIKEFTVYNGVNGGEDDSMGVDAWISEKQYNITIGVNAKFKSNTKITKYDVFQKLGNAKWEIGCKDICNEGFLVARKCPAGVIFTTSTASDWTSDKFKNVVVISGEDIYNTIGANYEGRLQNSDFWKESLNLMKK